MVVDAQIACAVDAFAGALRRSELLDDERGSLLATPIAASRLTRFQSRKQPLGQRRFAVEERVSHCRKYIGVGEHVSLHREPGLSEVARPFDALGARVCSGPSISGNSPELAKFRLSIGG